MNSETKVLKSKNSIFNKVLDTKLKCKYFSSFNLGNKLSYATFENDIDGMKSYSQNIYEIPIENKRESVNVTSTNAKLNRKYQSIYSNSLNSSTKFNTFVSDYRRHTKLNGKIVIQNSTDSIKFVKGTIYSRPELISYE
ncbi:hypothetical protein MN116_003673 [Schistosoma mekongi]|uniref:Uncharacterized protein n=1 Tax=Schistosoma mekongi TaxID=38744 RepID=A0AAE2D5P0_SCHME|nr:hypothetical protein MN116_003673 [Schistosoma mekongi]